MYLSFKSIMFLFIYLNMISKHNLYVNLKPVLHIMLYLTEYQTQFYLEKV